MFDPTADRYTAHLSPAGSIYVRTVALDNLVSRNEICPPDFVKIDIEGAEYDCLLGCAQTIQKYCPVIFLATHGPEIHDACLKLLADWEYDVRSLDERSPKQSDELVANPGRRSE